MFKRFTAGFAVGYVFGAQAGQKRYEQITDLAQRVVDTRVVAGLTDRASEYWTPDTARSLMSRIGERIAPGGSSRGQTAGDEEGEDDGEGPYDFDEEDEDAEGDEDDAEGEEESAYESGDAYGSGEPDEAEDDDDVVGQADDDDEGEYGAEAEDSGEEPASNGRRSRTHRSRAAGERPSGGRRGHKGGIRSLAVTARERGRVD